MPDIAMCDGEGCRKRQTCYRFIVKLDKAQSYIKPDPKTCQHYWPVCPSCGSSKLTEKMGGMVCDNCKKFHAYQKS